MPFTFDLDIENDIFSEAIVNIKMRNPAVLCCDLGKAAQDQHLSA